MSDIHEDELIGKTDVMQLVNLSRATIDRLRAAKKFPKARKFSERRIAWRAGDILDWNRNRPKAD